MIYRNLGKWGVKVSALSFGSWLTFGKMMDDATAEACMIMAYDHGVNFFDNAEGYVHGKSERVMGAILHKRNWPRDTYMVSSKVYFGVGDKPNQTGLSKKHIFEACHAALQRLQVDYLDFYYCHRPDSTTPIEETVWAMHQLIMQGKVLYWGTSEWSAQQIMQAWSFCREHHLVPPVVEQPQYNMFHRERFEREYQRLYSELGLGTTIWSPLASGALTGKYAAEIPADSRLSVKGLEWLRDSSITPDRQQKISALQSVASDLGCTLPQLAITWCLLNPNVSTVILGATKTTQLSENLKAIDMLPLLTAEIQQRIELVLQNKPELPKW
jgi:voltage-dependent potassium channel beta subunit